MAFSRTADGIETNIQVNHLSPMLLTLELLPVLEKSGNGRIVNTSSMAHRRNIYDFDDPEWILKPYDGVATYSQSKLFNLLFSLHLKTQLANSKMTVNTVHPGYVRTSLFNRMGERNWDGIPDAAQGARSALHAALSPELEGVSGKYIYLEGEGPDISNLAKDGVMAEKLWRVSLGIISVKCKTKSAKCNLLHFAFGVVHCTDQLSNFSLIQDYTKVVDFIEDTKCLV